MPVGPADAKVRAVRSDQFVKPLIKPVPRGQIRISFRQTCGGISATNHTVSAKLSVCSIRAISCSDDGLGRVFRMSVATSPGIITVDRIPLPPFSQVIVSFRAITARLVTFYPAPGGLPGYRIGRSRMIAAANCRRSPSETMAQRQAAGQFTLLRLKPDSFKYPSSPCFPPDFRAKRPREHPLSDPIITFPRL